MTKQSQCPMCDGLGFHDDSTPCDVCNGTGEIDNLQEMKEHKKHYWIGHKDGYLFCHCGVRKEK